MLKTTLPKTHNAAFSSETSWRVFLRLLAKNATLVESESKALLQARL